MPACFRIDSSVEPRNLSGPPCRYHSPARGLIAASITSSGVALMDAKIKPRAGEWYRQGGPDKFLGSTLPATLRQAGIKTVIVCGNSFQGATVGTASGAAQRGYKVIVPVDCSAGEDAYHEQYATYHLAKGGPAIVTSAITITRSAMVKF